MEPPTPTPIQIYLYPSQLAELQAIADRWHVSLEDVARQGIGTFLISQRVAEEPLSGDTLEDDPLRAIIGMFGSDVGDLAENHDKYLMEFEMESNQPWPEKSS
jgi:hypothetical protein